MTIVFKPLSPVLLEMQAYHPSVPEKLEAGPDLVGQGAQEVRPGVQRKHAQGGRDGQRIQGEFA